jgi:hypothetical protein
VPRAPRQLPTLAEVEALLDGAYICAEGAQLRKEDRKKAVEVTAFLAELARAVPAEGDVTLVDAAAGKAYLGLFAARLVLPSGTRVITIEREARHKVHVEDAARRLGVPVEARVGDVADPALWPTAPTMVTALHSCGHAADAILAAAVRAQARKLFVVPCCTPAGTTRLAESVGIPKHASVRRAFVEAVTLARRTLTLEAAGYRVEVVPFVPPTVTPYNLLFRARKEGEPGRMRHAREQLARLSREGEAA